MASPSKRCEMDVMKLMMSDYKVETINENLQTFNVTFHGATDSLYQGGVWTIRVSLPEAYPYEPPSIAFVNKIYHPNIGESSGSICVDVFNEKWSLMFDLINVFESFLPQLLLDPNPSDPLNAEAASLLILDPAAYELKVKEYCEKYAKLEKENSSDDDDDSNSKDGSDSNDDDSEIVGKANP